MKISEKLKLLRKQHSLTQEELADKIGVSKGVIGDIEIDRREFPSKEVAKKLATFFNVPTDLFLLENFEFDDLNKNEDAANYADADLVIDIMDAVEEFLSDNHLKLNPADRKDLIKHFCQKNYGDAARIKDILSGMLLAGSEIFAKNNGK